MGAGKSCAQIGGVLDLSVPKFITQSWQPVRAIANKFHLFGHGGGENVTRCGGSVENK
jgi:hypothetical protein